MRRFLTRSLLFGILHGVVTFTFYILREQSLFVGKVGKPGYMTTGTMETATSAVYFRIFNVLAFPFSVFWLFDTHRYFSSAAVWWCLYCLNSFCWGMALYCAVRLLMRKFRSSHADIQIA